MTNHATAQGENVVKTQKTPKARKDMTKME